MIQFYGSHICSGCREALALFQEKRFSDYQLIEITENVENLRAFLKLRDTLPELSDARKEGRIGIPLFLLEDGSVKLEPEEVL